MGYDTVVVSWHVVWELSGMLSALELFRLASVVHVCICTRTWFY